MRSTSRSWMTGAVSVVMASVRGARSARVQDRPTVERASPFSVAETVRRIQESVYRHGMSVFVCVEQPGAQPEGTLVIVLESSSGGTPVLMRSEDAYANPHLPLSLIVRPARDGTSEIIIPADLGLGDDAKDLPQALDTDFAELPALVADALR